MTQKRKLELAVRGMHCATCPDHVEGALRSVAGVEDVHIPGWGSNMAEVTVASRVQDEDLLAAVKEAGYPARVKTSQKIDPDVIKGDVTGSNGDGRKDFDLIVIGGGSAGFAAAIRAVGLGAKVALAEAGTIGGTCVNVGCLPSKTLIRAAEAWQVSGHHPFKGVDTNQVSIDWETIRAEKDDLVASIRQSKYGDILTAYPDIVFIEGHATFQEDGSLKVGDRIYRAGHYVITTGGRPRIVEFPGIKDAEPLNSTTLMDLEQLPKSLVILGGRAIALELGQTMARLGVQVLILQRSARLVPDHEPTIGRAIKDMLEHEGVGIITGVEVERLRREGDKRFVDTKVMGQERTFEADQILMALGRQPNTEGLHLENVGVDLDDNGAIVVDEYQQSSNPHIFAAGDVTTHPELVYVAAAGAKKAAENALTETKKPFDLSVVPSVIFTDPQIATVGLTEAQARRDGYEVKATTLDLEHVARAKAARDTRGFIKLVADADTNRLLGAHVLAAEGGEVIQTATLAIKFGLTIDDLTDTLFPYLTQVEGLKLAALSFEMDVALLSCCAG